MSFTCPVCDYRGAFNSIVRDTGVRKHAECPDCAALERHRLQFLVFKKFTRGVNTKKLKMLHFAPEDFFRDMFRKAYGEYVTADIAQPDVDFKEDLTKLSFKDGSFDLLYASHVMEYIVDDHKALAEVKRVLRPGGIAVLPVPVIGEATIEYDEAKPHETGHIRLPGSDYYRRYEKFFKLDLYKSDDFDEQYQLYVYEDRSKWPPAMPHRPSIPGERHLDFVPVCQKIFAWLVCLLGSALEIWDCLIPAISSF